MGKTTRRTTGLLIWAALTSVAAAAGAQESHRNVADAERAADGLPLAEQIDAYRALRGQLMSAAGSADVATREHLYRRVERKLALAIRRRATPEPAATERRAMAREAAEIGMLYLKEDNPEGAVAYEKVIEGIESPSPATGLLRNATREWFAENLQALLDGQSWAEAQKHLARWSQLLGDDPSVSEGRLTYASRRSERILSDLGSTKAEEALKLLDDERKLLPDQPAWKNAQASVREGLIKDIEKSALETKPDEMRRGIARFEHLFAEDERLSSLMANYDELVEKTLPAPITREYGMVKNLALRVDFQALSGSGEAETSLGDEITQDSATYVGYNVEYRKLSRNDKGQIPESGRWYGGRVTGAIANIKDDNSDDAVDLLLARPEFLIGWRGRQWSALVGLGVMIEDYTYDGAAYKLDGTGMSYASLSTGVERALGKHFSLFADVHYAGVSEIKCIDATAGLRYFPSPNFSINLGYWWFSSEVEPEDSADPDIELGLDAVVVGIALQF